MIVTGSVYIARRWLDKRSFESLGLKIDRRTLLDVLAGIGITFLQMGFIYVVMLGLGWLTFEGFAWKFDPISVVVSGVITFFIAFIFGGWNEELLSRGYHLQTIASGLNLFWGVIISSAVFGLLHIFNPNATWVSAAGIFFAGVYLAYGYLRIDPHQSPGSRALDRWRIWPGSGTHRSSLLNAGSLLNLHLYEAAYRLMFCTLLFRISKPITI